MYGCLQMNWCIPCAASAVLSKGSVAIVLSFVR
jgi:hypothetical protein